VPDSPHLPVLRDEALDALAIRSDGVYVDATFGAGGHSRAILARLGPAGKLIAFDVDPTAQPLDDPRCTLVRANFRTLEDHVNAPIDGILFDLGVSSMQLDTGGRGFSFQTDAPLDMRMDPSHGMTAYEFIVRTSERDLADAIREYGEERNARKIARSIKRKMPQTTAELARTVSGAVYRPGKRERIHPATRTFQALRIAVNDELAALQEGLQAAARVLRPGGRLVAITFHSLEDRIVKRFMRDDWRVRPLVRKPILPSAEEQARNPRSRSAKMRVAERITEAS
jgi:16S rRNA (cytosine1402-N4)-methyltransferase